MSLLLGWMGRWLWAGIIAFSLLCLLPFDAHAQTIPPPGMVEDINQSTAGTAPRFLTPAGDQLYYVAEDRTFGLELRRLNATANTSPVVIDVNPGLAMSNPGFLTPFGDALLFAATGSEGPSLWRTAVTGSEQDGATRLGPAFLAVNDYAYNPNLSIYLKPSCSLTTLDEAILFAGTAGGTDTEVWRSDGTVEGTLLLKDIVEGSEGSFPGPFYHLQNFALFFADTPNLGRELWRSDGTVEGTLLLKDVVPGPDDARKEAVAMLPTGLLFTVTTSMANELWISDGTSAGTRLIKNVTPLRGVTGDPTGWPGADNCGGFVGVTTGGRAYFKVNDHM